MIRNLKTKYRGTRSRNHFAVLSLLLISALTLSNCKITRQKGQAEIKLDQLTFKKPEKSQPEIDDIRVELESSDFSELIYPDEMASFYSNRANKLAWIKNGKLNRNADELLNALRNAWKDGLSPEYYPLLEIDELIMELKKKSVQKGNMTDIATSLDMLLTQVYFDYASDIAEGRHTPSDLNILWEVHPRKHALIEHLEEALRKRRIIKSVEDLAPNNEKYSDLKEAYQKLYLASKEKDWPLPGRFSTLHPGDHAEPVVDVKKYLAATEDLLITDSAYVNSRQYDDDLRFAVEEFQKRHGLKPDGIIGKKTRREMNKPIAYRLEQMRVNLDRMRWENQQEKDKDLIVINIPDFSLTYFKDDHIENQMNVVVGQNDHYTPILTDTITYLVFNPNWKVPRSIATKEMLPKIKNDTTFLNRNDYILLENSYISTDTINPQTVNWDSLTVENFPYFIVQKPGSYNALGRIKFMMPNNYSIYLHDTPASHLFQREERNFSHGCIRLERPVELAENLLDHQLSKDSIARILWSNERKEVLLEKPIPVHFVYHTAWSDFQGKLHFRNDIYGFDQRSILQLQKQKVKSKLVVRGQEEISQ